MFDRFSNCYFKFVQGRVPIEIGSGSNPTAASVKMIINGQGHILAQEGNGPVDALFNTMKKILSGVYECASEIELIDFKVDVPNVKVMHSAACTKVEVELRYNGSSVKTIGEDTDLVKASAYALIDAFVLCLEALDVLSLQKKAVNA